MFTLPCIFSSGALFQAGSALRLHGTASPDSVVEARLIRPDGTAAVQVSAKSGHDGAFSVEIMTPAASFDEYTIILTDGDSEHVMEHVLFGELWLAGGQSNMELQNNSIPGYEALFELMKTKVIRVFKVYRSKFCHDGLKPYDPDEMTPGEWAAADDEEGMRWVSALAYRFAGGIYDFLNQTGDVPVGFLNANNGGTPIAGWLPRDAVESDERIGGMLKQFGTFPYKEDWNTKGDENGNQTSAMYNFKIAPIEGVRVRGILWYQGENDACDEYERHCYTEFLRFYYKIYAERFAADPAHFMMLCVLIYPLTYGDTGDCHAGYLNQAIIEAATEEPDKFACIPTSDLSPAWDFARGNHPAHPVHKYELGERLTALALRCVYGADGQDRPAVLDRIETVGGKMILTFRGVGSGLRVGDGSPYAALHGLYLAGDDGVYLPAEYEITSPDTLTAWVDGIDSPKHAAYGIISFEPEINLFAGDFPVTPFYTDRTQFLLIEQRPWYDTARTSQWTSRVYDNSKDMFYHPVFRPVGDTEICPDPAFRHRSTASLRVASEEDEAGFYVRSYRYQLLDLQKFAGIGLSLFHMNEISASVTLSGDGFSLEFPLTEIADEGLSWKRYEARFAGLPEGEIKTMRFTFRFAKEDFRFVNVERIRLLK